MKHAHNRMAELCVNLGLFDESTKYLESSKNIYSSIDDYYIEANKLFAEENYSEALEISSKAMELWKEGRFDTTLNLNLEELLTFTADTMLNDDDANGALQIYLEVLKINNNNANAYFGAGVSYLKLDSKDDAVRMFEWVLRINPEYEMAKNMLDRLKENAIF